MKPVQPEETAKQEIEGWAEFFETSLDKETINSLLPAVMRGRVTFDTANEVFTIKLKSPIQLENGETLSVLTMREPTVAEIMDGKKPGMDELVYSLKLYSKITGQALGILQRLKQRDLMTLSAVYLFFV